MRRILFAIEISIHSHPHLSHKINSPPPHIPFHPKQIPILTPKTPSEKERKKHILIPAFNEFPIISVVHPAYQALPNFGHGSFPLSGNLLFSCVRVFANSNGYVIAISTAPAVLPAMMLRSAEGLCLGGSEVLAVVVAMVGGVRMTIAITNTRNELKSYALSKESKKSYLSTNRDSRGRETLFSF